MPNSKLHKTALITGAGSGIGLQCAHVLAEKAYNLVIVGRTSSKIMNAAKELQVYPVKIHPIVLDLALPESTYSLFNYCKEQQLDIDVLICNAGISLGSTLSNTSPESIINILELHIIHTTLLCRLIGEEMKQKKAGHILIVSSLTSFTPFPTMSLYAASKSYLHYFAKALRAELKSHNVHVSELCPGGVDTPMVSKDNFFIATASRLGMLSNAKDVAKESIDKLFKHKARITPCLFYRILIFFLPFVPKGIIVFLYTHSSMFANKKR